MSNMLNIIPRFKRWIKACCSAALPCLKVVDEDERQADRDQQILQEASSKFAPQFRIVSVFQVTKVTLPETKIAPENRVLEKEIPIGNHHF